MLDIAYLALMLACLAGCVFLVDRLSRSDESATSPGIPSPDTASFGAKSPDAASFGAKSTDAASTYAASSESTEAGR